MIEVLKDQTNRVIGFIRDDPNRIVIFDKSNQTLGWYIKSENNTYNASNQRIGSGNQIMRLLKD